jgi:hypothetical protein
MFIFSSTIYLIDGCHLCTSGLPSPSPLSQYILLLSHSTLMSNVKLSKALSWVLRHSAPSLGLQLAPDGFVQVQSVLSLDHPRFRKDGQPKFSVDDAIQVVENFRLECCTLLEDGTLLKEDIVNGTTQNTASGDANQSKDHVEKTIHTMAKEYSA